MFPTSKRKRQSFGRSSSTPSSKPPVPSVTPSITRVQLGVSLINSVQNETEGKKKVTKSEKDFNDLFNAGSNPGDTKDSNDVDSDVKYTTTTSTTVSLSSTTSSSTSITATPTSYPPSQKRKSITSFFKPVSSNSTNRLIKKSCSTVPTSNEETKSTTNSKTISDKNNNNNNSNNNNNNTQYYLDFGQSTFNQSLTCPICNTMYQPSIPSEVLSHQKTCSPYKLGVKFPNPKSSSPILSFKTSNAKLDLVKKIVDSEMGFCDDEIPPHLTTYIYLNSSSRCVGYLTVHPLSSCYSLLSSPSPSSPLLRSSSPLPSRIGVRQIWVHSKSRSKGVATKLLDQMCKSIVFGCEIKREEVAFSSPTGDGARLAKKWQKNVRVYDC
ncbi:hypothetical protein TrST_g2284 [Triparma strigata]|uniref:N-acetyltransferase ESCO acetyl-transferase domain-containing protein n=1 Tax=Triparma strigata TaxID=1606541 RepID=A0A9W7AJX4_9STRA|nr:hypothetical protein TrST_g2284 [Triparma strigata]